MFVEGGEEGEDNVRRGTDEDSSETTPVVDVFDQLLGVTPSGEPPAPITINNTPPSPTVLPPASQPPKPASVCPNLLQKQIINITEIQSSTEVPNQIFLKLSL